VFKVIEKHGLVVEGDKIFVALSGGKDSAASLYCLKKYVDEKGFDAEITGLHVRVYEKSNAFEVIKSQCDLLEIDLVTVDAFKELDVKKAAARSHRPVCSVCGIVKRYFMNKAALEHGASKLATGHNADDFIAFFFKNFLNQEYEWISKFKPVVKGSGNLITRIRPLFFITGEEALSIVRKSGLPVLEGYQCPALEGKVPTDKWKETVKLIESRHRGFKKAMIKSIYKTSSYYPESKETLKSCVKCGMPTNTEVCAFCRLKNYEH